MENLDKILINLFFKTYAMDESLSKERVEKSR